MGKKKVEEPLEETEAVSETIEILKDLKDMKKIQVTKNKFVFWDKSILPEVIGEDGTVQNSEAIQQDLIYKFSLFIRQYFEAIETNDNKIERKNQIEALKDNYFYNKYQSRADFTIEDLNNFKFN